MTYKNKWNINQQWHLNKKFAAVPVSAGNNKQHHQPEHDVHKDVTEIRAVGGQPRQHSLRTGLLLWEPFEEGGWHVIHSEIVGVLWHDDATPAGVRVPCSPSVMTDHILCVKRSKSIYVFKDEVCPFKTQTLCYNSPVSINIIPGLLCVFTGIM